MAQQDFIIEQEHGEFNIFEYLGLLRKHLILIFGFGAMGLAIGLTYWFITPPKFRSSAILKMSHMSQDVIGFGQQFVWNPYREEFFKTEFQIMQSQPVAELVVRNLGLSYFSPDDETRDEDDNLASVLVEELESNDDHAKRSPDQRVAKIAIGLLGSVDADSIRGTNLVSITYTSKSPERAQTVANAWASAYIAHDLDVNYEKNLEAYTFISNKADDLRIKIDTMVKEMGRLRQEKNIVPSGDNSSANLDALTRISDAILEAETQLAEREARYERLANISFRDSNEVNQSPLVKDLAARLAQERSDYDRNLKIYKPQAPNMEKLKNQIDSMERELNSQRRRVYSQLLADARADITAKQAEAKRLNDSFERARKENTESKVVAKSQIDSMESQIKVMRQQLEMLDFKKEELDLALSLKNIGRSDKVIVQQARMSASPFAPSLKRYGLAGLVLGLFVAAGLIFLLEVTDRKVHSADMLERLTGVPTLSTIPRYSTGEKGGKAAKADAARERAHIAFVSYTSPTSPFAETYRHLRTNIQLSRAERNTVMLLTSSVSGEGKTVSSTNLAISIAQLEKRVLLVDCDLRRPKMHSLFRVENKKGVVNAIIEREPTEKLIHHTAVPSLDLLTSGPLPPNPSELLASNRMDDVLREWRELYDFVIIDTSPLLAVTDASILAHKVDSVVFVAKASVTIRDDAVRALKLLEQNNIRALGTLLNAFDFDKGRKYGYKYGYRRYGYGYGPYEYKAEKA